jgi:hypothetical protein
VERRNCQIHSQGQLEEDLNLIRSSARPKTQARSEQGKGREKKKVREMEVQVMSYCRAHWESVPRRVWV